MIQIKWRANAALDTIIVSYKIYEFFFSLLGLMLLRRFEQFKLNFLLGFELSILRVFYILHVTLILEF